MYLVIIIFIAVVGIVLGSLATYLTLKMWRQENLEYINKLSESILEKANLEAKAYLESKILDAENQSNAVLKNVDNIIAEKHENLRLRESQIADKEIDIELSHSSLKKKTETLEQVKMQLDEISRKKIAFLENASNISVDEAKKHLFMELENEVRFNASLNLRKIVDEMNANAFKEAKRIIISAMQRIASEQSVETSSSVIHLEDNNQKEIIIGKDGRNIKSL